MTPATEVYDLVVSEHRPRRRWRWLWGLLSGVLSEGAFTGEAEVRSVCVIRRTDDALVLEQEGMQPDVVDLLVKDWAALSAELFAERWL